MSHRTRGLVDAVAIEARCRARELVVRKAPRARVSFVGEGEVEHHREGIPPTGTEDGERYRDVEAEISIRSRPQQRP